MTLSAIHNQSRAVSSPFLVVCDYRGDMTLSAIHNPYSEVRSFLEVVCDIGGI